MAKRTGIDEIEEEWEKECEEGSTREIRIEKDNGRGKEDDGM